MFLPLQHGLGHHLSDPRFAASGQIVYVGTKPLADDWVVAVIRIDNVVSETQASWFGACIGADVLTHLRFANQENVPPEAVNVEHGVPAGGVEWSVAVYITLGSMREAKAMVDFLTGYADLGFD
jgi:hypothetical protein